MSELIVTLNGKKNTLEFLNNSKAICNGQEFDFEIFENVNNVYFLRIGKKIYNFTVVEKNNNDIIIFSGNERFDLTIRTALQQKAIDLISKRQVTHNKLEIRAPMPGLILRVLKNKGDKINDGEPVMILEAMKMENEIRSPSNGTIKEIFIEAGSAVEKGSILYLIED